jgi:hypothetical protein
LSLLLRTASHLFLLHYCCRTTEQKQAQKAATEKLEKTLQANFSKEDNNEEDTVFLTGSGIESPTRGRK